MTDSSDPTDDNPAWWHAGTPVDITSTDLVNVEMLEDDEWDLEWRLCLVPVSDLPPCFLDTDHLPLVHMPDESRKRFAEIREWIGERPISEMLATAPIFGKLIEAKKEDTGIPYLHFLDGCHRTTVAVQAGETEVPFVMGLDTWDAAVERGE